MAIKLRHSERTSYRPILIDHGDIMNLSPIAQRAYIALRDCGVIRTRFDHDGYLELFENGIADLKHVENDECALDWSLSETVAMVASL